MMKTSFHPAMESVPAFWPCSRPYASAPPTIDPDALNENQMPGRQQTPTVRTRQELTRPSALLGLLVVLRGEDGKGGGDAAFKEPQKAAY